MDLLDRKSVSWRYYEAHLGDGLWQGPDAILHLRNSKEFATNVVAPSKTILTDIAAGQLADVVWLTPTAHASDHRREMNGTGPSWVAAVVNAVGESEYWNNTAIFLMWDDWGGRHYHVPPPQYNSYELGFRVPLVGLTVPRQTLHFSRAARVRQHPEVHRGDVRLAIAGHNRPSLRHLSDCFDFSQSPTKFKKIPAKYPPAYFFTQRSWEPAINRNRFAPLVLAFGAICSGCAQFAATPGVASHAASSRAAPIGSYKSIYSFGGKADDGRTPAAGLIALGGELYGTTEDGGTTNAYCRLGCGTVFRVDTSGAEQTIYRFGGASGGANPTGTLIALNGVLYGTTSGGGLAVTAFPDAAPSSN